METKTCPHCGKSLTEEGFENSVIKEKYEKHFLQKGISVDEILCNPQHRKRFVRMVDREFPHVIYRDEYSILKCLIRLRKAGKLETLAGIE